MNNNSAQKFFGIIILKEVLENRELRLPDKLLYGYIASYKKYCAEPNYVIADRIGISISSVAHGIARLKQHGLVFVKKSNDDNSKRQLYALLGKPGLAHYLQQNEMWKSCGKVDDLSAPRARSRAPRALEKTGNVVHEMHIKNKRIKKNIENLDDFGEAECPPKAMKGAFGGLACDSQNLENFEKEFYRRNTIVIGAD